MIKLTPKRYDKIQAHADRIFSSNVFLSFPVDIESLIRNTLGIDFGFYSEYSEEEQALYYNESDEGFGYMSQNNMYIIRVNDAKSVERQRFTMAHEFGHFILGHFSRKGVDSKVKETEANFFAANLLAPVWAIRRLQSIDEWSISEAFDISFESAIYRFNSYMSWLKSGMPTTDLVREISQYCIFFRKEVKITYVE